MEKQALKSIGISLLIVLAIVFTTSGCTDSSPSHQEQKLKQLESEVIYLSELYTSKEREVNMLNEKIHELKIYESGLTPRYILKVKLKQSRISLDIGKHIKDKINEIEFEIPVDKEFYHSVSVGTKITNKFRAGSFIINGSFSHWRMTISDKKIV